MARSKSLQPAQTAEKVATDAAPLQESVQPAGQAQLRQRRRRPARQQPAAAVAGGAAADAEGADPAASMSRWVYYPRQYGGVTLSALACCCTALCYDQQDPFRVWKMLAWMALALVALAVHELRPYKRKNYGDLAREQGMGWGRMLGF